MKLRKTPLTLRKIAATKKRQKDRELQGQVFFQGNDSTAIYNLDTAFSTGDILTIHSSAGDDVSIHGILPDNSTKNPKRVHPARKRKVKQNQCSTMVLNGTTVRMKKISETKWIILDGNVS